MRRLQILILLASLIVVPAPANAEPSFYVGPIFSIATATDGGLLVADAARGVVKVDASGPHLVAVLPGVVDVAPMSGGGLWALTGGMTSTLYKIGGDGVPVPFADIAAYEVKHDPHPASVDSNAWDVVDLGGGAAAVADAGGNDLLLVDKHGKVKLIAVLPDQLVSTDNAKHLVGCPTPIIPDFAFVCFLPPMIPAQPVATSVAIGPDGAFYVGELKGFPAPTNFSRIWRIERDARNVRCSEDPACGVVLDGFTSVIDLVFGPDGRLYVTQIDDASWAAVELALPGALGGSVRACSLATHACQVVASGLSTLTSITFLPDGSLWGATNQTLEGPSDVIKLGP